MTEPQRALPQRFEIVHEKDAPRRRARRTKPSAVGAFFGAIRTIIEDAYVSLARESMVRVEQIEDARAARGHAARARRVERQRLRQRYKSEVSAVAAGATPAAAKPAA